MNGRILLNPSFFLAFQCKETLANLLLTPSTMGQRIRWWRDDVIYESTISCVDRQLLFVPNHRSVTPRTQLITLPGGTEFCVLHFVYGHEIAGRKSNEFGTTEQKNGQELDMRTAWRHSYCVHETEIENSGGVRTYPHGGRASSPGI
jgi:hypothetical protein